MRKVRALLISTALAAGVLVSMTATPAQAESIRYAYFLQSDCYNGGSLGIQWGWWTSFHCDYDNNSHYYFLWA
ncbi:hypothetical protein GCM10022419_089510 [Nonomuraea rosea]|uniref:Uncharacterized protein n=1 Tax=Nonomuraea rosea TaxID=638574 RepID=A0ABP6YZW2_9ACTN